VANLVNKSVNLQNKKKEWHMTISKMTRSFRYAGLILPDPAPDLDVESVRSLYAASYPEITTAALTGPEAVDGTLVYIFTKAIGTKG
jgi:PRTRC genetic system protein C